MILKFLLDWNLQNREPFISIKYFTPWSQNLWFTWYIKLNPKDHFYNNFIKYSLRLVTFYYVVIGEDRQLWRMVRNFFANANKIRTIFCILYCRTMENKFISLQNIGFWDTLVRNNLCLVSQTSFHHCITVMEMMIMWEIKLRHERTEFLMHGWNMYVGKFIDRNHCWSFRSDFLVGC